MVAISFGAALSSQADIYFIPLPVKPAAVFFIQGDRACVLFGYKLLIIPFLTKNT
jgi:hypothetical protein